MRRIISSSALVLCIAGCTTSLYPTYTAGGNQGYRVTCGGLFGDGDMGSCYQSAGVQCGTNGFRILQTSVSSMIFECRNEETNKEPLLTQ